MRFPPRGSTSPSAIPGRGPYLKWLFFGPSVIEPAIVDRSFPRAGDPPRAALGYGDFDTAMNVVAGAVSPGPFLMGERFTAADVIIGAGVRWGTAFKLIPERKEFTDYVARFADRPAAKRAKAKDEQLAKA